MVCDAENKKSRAVFAYMTGMTSGGIISGYISDKSVDQFYESEKF